MKAPPGPSRAAREGRVLLRHLQRQPRGRGPLPGGAPPGRERPILVRWSHGSGRPDSNDDAPYVRGMAVSFVLPDGSSTDILGQTVPRFPVRTPEDFVRLSEVARDRKALAEFLATRPRTALALAANARAKALGSAAELRRGDVLPDPRLPLADAWRGTAPGCATASCRRRRRGTDPRSGSPGATGCARRSWRGWRQGPVRVRPGGHRRRPKDDPHNPMSVWKGSREFVAGWLDDHHARGRPRGRGRRRGVRPDPGRRRHRAAATTRSCGTGRGLPVSIERRSHPTPLDSPPREGARDRYRRARARPGPRAGARPGGGRGARGAGQPRHRRGRHPARRRPDVRRVGRRAGRRARRRPRRGRPRGAAGGRGRRRRDRGGHRLLRPVRARPPGSRARRPSPRT